MQSEDLSPVGRELRAPRAAGIAGVVFSALFVASTLLLRHHPQPGASLTELRAFYTTGGGRGDTDRDGAVLPVGSEIEDALHHLAGFQIRPRHETASLAAAIDEHLHVRAADVHGEHLWRLRFRRRVLELAHMPSWVSPTAAASAITSACSVQTRPPGIDSSPARSRRRASTLSAPVTSQRIRRARSRVGYVSVMRRRP